MSNKPILPNAYVNINNQNLGLTPAQLSGIFAFVGIAVDGSETAETIVSVGGINEVRTKIGYGELADSLIEFFNNGGRKAYAWRVEPTTVATINTPMTPTRFGTSTGTITVALESGEICPNDFNLKVEILKTGDDGVAKFKYSTDGGVNWSPSLVVPVATTYVIPTTHVELTFVKGAGAVYWEDGDTFAETVDAPEITNAKVESAVDAFIASSNTFDAIVVSVPADSALVASVKTKVENAEAKPNFRYCYGMLRPALSTSAGQAVTQATTIMATIASDRIQIVTGEGVLTRSNHNDTSNKSEIGIIAGRRSSLAISEDVGLVSKGQVNGVVSVRTGWTDTTIEDLDGLRTCTLRVFKGLSGFYVTNGHMSDGFSDVKKDAWRLVLDKASNRARLASLSFVKVKVNPADVTGSTQALQDAIDNSLGLMVGDEDIVDKEVVVPAGQDVLTTEEILVNISVVPYGHASFIGITIGLINPLRVAS